MIFVWIEVYKWEFICKQIYQSPTFIMSDEIEDLIANIEQKFDDQFKDSGKQLSGSKSENQNKKNAQELYNPEADRDKKINPTNFVKEERNKQEIVIEDDQQQEMSSHREDDNRHKNDQPQLQHQDDHHEDNYEQGDQEGQNKYKELSHKLETALKKISSSKNGFQTFNQTQSSNLLNRFEQYERKKQKELDQKRKLEEQKKYHGLKSKPDINSKSRKIAEQTSYKPIYERFDKILEEKKKKMEQNQEHKKMKQEQKYEQFINEFKKHSKLQTTDCRDSQTYFNDMLLWKQKLEKQRQQKLQQKEEKQKEGYTFKPQINKKSVRMLKNQKRVPIQERQIQRPKTQQSQYTFQPRINKRRVK